MTLNGLRLFIENAIGNINGDVYFSAQAGERGFCYEFYHQMKTIWAQTGFTNNNIVLSSEIKKLIRQTRKYPDFVIHEFSSYNHQMVAFEVKNNLTTNILKRGNNNNLFIRQDIEKLISYQLPIAEQGLNYSISIFIAINTEHEKMQEYRAALEGLELLNTHAQTEITSNNDMENLDNSKLLFAMFRHTNGLIEWKNVSSWLEEGGN